MFTVYYANQISQQKEILIRILKDDPNPNPFAPETILVQSIGMAQWLQMQIAQELGVSGNLNFPYPTSFLWQQYRTLFPDLPKENIFARTNMIWRLMRLIPSLLTQEEFTPLACYLEQNDQLKCYQLASKIADLFDQYLVYRPEWLIQWEKGDTERTFNEIVRSPVIKGKNQQEIQTNLQWQSMLWNHLVADIKQDTDTEIFNTSHRAYLQQRYFEKLDSLSAAEKAKLPVRIFVFGISSLPPTQLAVLQKLSEHCQVHLFFTNPCELFWGDDRDDKLVAKLALNQSLSQTEFDKLLQYQGNPLLATWGKQGKAFLNLLTELEPQEISYYHQVAEQNASLLNQVKQAILKGKHQCELNPSTTDESIQIHSCHSKMREIEVLHNALLQRFEQDPSLSPKDVIVMSPDIDAYAPYIHAVFARYERQDPRFIPFTLSDQKISYINPIIASFLQLLTIHQRKFSAEELLELFDIQAIRTKYELTAEQIFTLREWVKAVGVRAGLYTEQPEWQNYNAWENGLNRLLLGCCLKEEHHPWQDIVAFNESYGLSAVLTGAIAKFIENLTAWNHFIQSPHGLAEWKSRLTQLLSEFYQEQEESLEALLLLSQTIEQLFEPIEQANFNDQIEISVIAQLFEQQFSEQRSHLNFLVGKVNFCTLLPMRAIPFKIVCLIGMNEGDYPRQQINNSFDLMQYCPRKGDRAKRDDDRYLFLEALLAAQQQLYISYIGQSLTGDQKKLPSILVSQLYDYLADNMVNKEAVTRLQVQQAMTVFSPKNFIQGKIAYDQEWLAAKQQQHERSDFLTPLVRDTAELPTEIELEDLIAYLQSPARFFFRRQLGVRFEQEAGQIAESESFTLSQLEKYQLLDELLSVENSECFFESEKLKGNLPANHFGELSQQELTDSIKLLRTTLSGYLQRERELIEVDFSLLIPQPIRLLGHIPHRFGNQVILWRVGNLRDKDIIQSWLYYLVLKATRQPVNELRFYYRAGDQARSLTFSEIEQETACRLLTNYVQDYLASFHELKWAITQGIGDYLQQTEETYGEEVCLNALHAQKDIYIERILAQTARLDFEQLHQRTLAWFELMMKSIKED